QSAVSRQVAVTEKAVGTPLFERHARGTRPTPAGEALARHAGKVLDDIAAATQELAGMRDRLAGRLVVAGFPAAPAALPPPGIAEPKITFTARDWPTRLGLVAAGLGIALVPGIAAQAVPRGVRWIPVHDDTGGLRRTVWAATNDSPSAAATAMVHALEEEVSS